MPRAIKREAAEQDKINNEVKNLSLYQFPTCPFCIKVRRQMRRLNLPLELRNARIEGIHRHDLLSQGGKIKAPCLRIEQADGSSKWMYESNDIIDYLNNRFA